MSYSSYGNIDDLEIELELEGFDLHVNLKGWDTLPYYISSSRVSLEPLIEHIRWEMEKKKKK